MWNYRIIRKKQKNNTYYSYGIHEVFYDENGFAGLVTTEPIDICDNDISHIRDKWIMMAEAFGQKILDFDIIPEPEYNGCYDASCECSKDDEKYKYEPDYEFDEERYLKEFNDEQMADEKHHIENYIGLQPFSKL